MVGVYKNDIKLWYHKVMVDQMWYNFIAHVKALEKEQIQEFTTKGAGYQGE